MTVQRFRKRPVTIEAMRLIGTPAETHAVYQWIEANTLGSFQPPTGEDDWVAPESGVSIDPATGDMLIATLEGVMHARLGDWIVRGVQGEFYPVRADIFEATYDPEPEGGAPAGENGPYDPQWDNTNPDAAAKPCYDISTARD